MYCPNDKSRKGQGLEENERVVAFIKTLGFDPLPFFCSVTAVDGGWSRWSVWSVCGADCTQMRRRSCDEPSASQGGRSCQGRDTQVSNCTGGLCSGECWNQLILRDKEITRSLRDGDIFTYFQSHFVVIILLSSRLSCVL